MGTEKNELRFMTFPISLLGELNIKEPLDLSELFRAGVYYYAVNKLNTGDVIQDLKDSALFLNNINLESDQIQRILDTGYRYDIFPNSKQVTTSCDINILSEMHLRHCKQRKRLQFIAYLALRSIIGKRKMCATNLDHIIFRMLGYTSVKDFNAFEDLSNAQLDLYCKVNNHHKMKKLMEQLEIDWGFIFYSARGNRSYYYSIKGRMTETQLIQTVIENQTNNRAKLNNKRKKEIENSIKKSHHLK